MRVRVKAGMMGYYDHKRRREGDVFNIKGEHEDKNTGKIVNDFSEKWMEKVSNKIETGTAPPKKKFGPVKEEDVVSTVPVIAEEVGQVVEAPVVRKPGRPKKVV